MASAQFLACSGHWLDYHPMDKNVCALSKENWHPWQNGDMLPTNKGFVCSNYEELFMKFAQMIRMQVR